MITYENTTIEQATAIQNAMREQIILSPLAHPVKTIAGADISHNKFSDTVYAGIVVLSYPDMVVQSWSLVEDTTTFPYVPGYLGFREVPALLKAWEQLPFQPDVTILDGQGITHPRRMGIASHFGVLTNSPAIGCAKSMLYGRFSALPDDKGSSSPIYNTAKELLGNALRTKKGVKPVFISPGHKITVEESLAVMRQCILKHRIPEPTRMAHNTVNQFRIGQLKAGFHKADVQTGLFDAL